jgi:trehalose 6-phosphate synthase
MPGVLSPSKDAAGRASLLLVSNRLPITIKRSDDGNYTFSMSSGGLVTGISGLAKEVNFTWYGWPGLDVPESERGPMIETLKRDFSAAPVFGNKEDMDKHYNGFSSKSPSHVGR